MCSNATLNVFRHPNIYIYIYIYIYREREREREREEYMRHHSSLPNSTLFLNFYVHLPKFLNMKNGSNFISK